LHRFLKKLSKRIKRRKEKNRIFLIIACALLLKNIVIILKILFRIFMKNGKWTLKEFRIYSAITMILLFWIRISKKPEKKQKP